MRAFDRWRALTAEEQRLTMRSAMAVGAAVAALRVVGVARTLRLASRAHPSTSLGVTLSLSKGQGRPLNAETKNVIEEVVAAVERAGRYVLGSTCLSNSLALAWMLRGMGVAASVRIGVKTAGGFEAHAWVECGGVAVNDASQPAARYATVVDSL